MSVELSFRDNCALLTLNRPEALNALSFGILGEIGEAFDQVANSRARALIITGAGQRNAASNSARPCSRNSTLCRLPR